MPLYEYECEADGRRFEVIQKFSDPPVTTCPTCGGAVRKLLSSPAIQFKGSGWYITDYARKGSTDPGKDTKSGSNASGTSSESGSGSKAESSSSPASDSAPAKAKEAKE
jgi:putative FmdB family regulatory protein